MLLEEIQGSESPEEKVYVLDIYLLLFCLEQHYVYSKSNHTGDKRSHFLKTHTFPSNVVMLMFIFSRHQHHKSAFSKPCIPVLQKTSCSQTDIRESQQSMT